MAKKTSAKSSGTAKVPAAKKKAASKKAPSKKSSAKKTTKKAATKKAATKKTVTKKTAAKKSSVKKAPAKKAPAKKSVSKKTTTAKKTAAKKAPTQKSTGKKSTSAGSASKGAAAGAGDAKAAGAATSAKASSAAAEKAGSAAGADGDDSDDKKGARKGITIVSKKTSRRAKPKTETPRFVPPGGPLLGPGLKRRAPLIASGPKNKVPEQVVSVEVDPGVKLKSPFNKRKLDKYREILIAKRRVLVGELTNLEFQALKSESGSLSNLPQHSAEQGSDTTEQSISLGMADADRQLIREIDAALQRIEDGTYGVCVQTGQPISEDRLEELPWAKLSIEAARAIDRGFRR